jgi:DNA replication and repair protein RecF
MYVTYLSLTNFRNYARLELGVPRGPIVLHGHNAQGKTSLLEAIYYLVAAQSPHASTDRQVIHWLADEEPLPYARIIAEVVDEDQTKRIEITLLKEPINSGDVRLRKEIRVNSLPRRVMDLLGEVNVVAFLPQDMALVEGSPGRRRRYLDATLCQINTDYCRSLAQYTKVLSQRNALLKQLQDRRASGASDQLDFWDQKLAVHGAVVVAARNRLVRELERHAQAIHHMLTAQDEHLRLHYHPSFDPMSHPEGQMAFPVGEMGASALPEMPHEEVAERFLAALRANHRDNIARGMTTLGPHRDELRFVVNGHDLGHYGSRGQGRTAVLALKLAELNWMHDVLGRWPILLLDEVAAELDSRRRTFLLEHVDSVEQSLLTTAEPGLFEPGFLEGATVWRVEAGRIT